MIVRPIAATGLIDSQFKEPLKYTALGRRLPRELSAPSDLLAEFAGRACYQSFDLPNPDTYENEDYLANIIEQAHFSVLEHASITFYVEGVSRSLTHELVRHRHLSYSQLSQRYVASEDAEYVTPPALVGVLDETVRETFERAVKVYEDIVLLLGKNGVPRKKAREAARSVLPNMTETKIVVTGNMRAWRDLLHKRHHVAADAEIQEFAKLVLEALRIYAPNSVQDIPDEPFGTVAK